LKNLLKYTYPLAILLIGACASLQTPQGGPRDLMPPKVLIESPKSLSKNFKSKNIEITFDEYFKLANEFTEISISPTIEISPIFKTKQKTLEIAIKDTLEKNTTYTINFGKSIQDINEANILKNYSYVFSTGPVIDSLQIKGRVFNSNDNKPVFDATVFIFPLSKDSLMGKKKPSYYTNTDSSGNFSLKNLRADQYKIYALKESAADRIYNGEKEEIAFLAEAINLKKDTNGIVLNLFTEIPKTLRLLDRKIDSDGKIIAYFNKSISNPSISFIDNKEIKNEIIEFSTKGDSLNVWLRTLEFDSLKIAINENKITQDTITFRRSKKDTYQRKISFTNNLSNGKIKPGNTLELKFSNPINKINIPEISLLEDSVLKTNFKILKIEKSERLFKVEYPWKTKKRYTLIMNENSIEDIYETNHKELKLDFEIDDKENYGSLNLNISKLDSAQFYVLQLITETKKIYKEFAINKMTTNISLLNIPTSKYLVKIIADGNKNGQFDTGNIASKIQPEKSWFWEKEIITRANWDREEKIEIPLNFDLLK
jgi:hypothetical protein